MPLVTLVDYGAGNLLSVVSAIEYLGAKVEIISDPQRIAESSVLVLPGVGSFKKGMEAIKGSSIDKSILYAVKSNNAKILGICMGMQLMGSYGTEDGGAKGLGLISNRVERFNKAEINGNKLPHVGFNTVNFSERKGLFKGLPKSSDFYFTHSYRMLVNDIDGRYATCQYGKDFLAAFQVNNIYGTQFHPEKSQTNGLILLRNFLRD